MHNHVGHKIKALRHSALHTITYYSLLLLKALFIFILQSGLGLRLVTLWGGAGEGDFKGDSVVIVNITFFST